MAMEIVSSPSLDQSDETDPGPPGPTCIEDLKKIFTISQFIPPYPD